MICKTDTWTYLYVPERPDNFLENSFLQALDASLPSAADKVSTADP